MSFAVSVTFEIHAENFDAFASRMKTQATDSLEKEEGCHEFKVWADYASPCKVYLYEICENAAAFHAHLQSDHFQAFDRETASWVAAKQVTTWDRPII